MAKASKQTVGKALARERAIWVRDRALAELRRLREAIKKARDRRRSALDRARQLCARARVRVRGDVRAFRSKEFKRINAEAAAMRLAARNQCQARKHRVRVSAAVAVARRRLELEAERKQQLQISRADNRARRQRNTYKERAQENDDAVRSNLPRELVPVFDRVRRHIKGSKHRTRTEAFLEWAEEHPEDVLSYQGDQTDREVAQLIAERAQYERQLRKATPRARARRAAGGDVPF
jgi:hypothetical protein